MFAGRWRALRSAALACLLCIALPAGAQVALTQAERDWVQHAPTVVVGVQSDYAPFSYVDGNGHAASHIPSHVVVRGAPCRRLRAARMSRRPRGLSSPPTPET